jgi:hypothetical protein
MFGDILERLFGINFFTANLFGRFIDEDRVFEDEQVRVKNATWLGADAVNDLALDFAHMLSSLGESVFQARDFARDFFVSQLSARNDVAGLIKDEDFSAADASGDRDAPEDFFTLVQPFGHASGIAAGGGFGKTFLAASDDKSITR